MSGKEMRFQVPPKTFRLDGWIMQRIWQWVPNRRTGDWESLGVKSAVTKPRNIQFATALAEQRCWQPGNFGDWQAAVGEVPSHTSWICRTVYPLKPLSQKFRILTNAFKLNLTIQLLKVPMPILFNKKRKNVHKMKWNTKCKVWMYMKWKAIVLTILLLISWKWISQTLSTTLSLSNVTNANPVHSNNSWTATLEINTTSEKCRSKSAPR